jgi:hypothetical protein
MRFIKPRRIKWVGHVARMGAKWNSYKVPVGELEGKGLLEDLEVNEKIIFRWILEKHLMGTWAGLIWLMIDTNGGFL